MIVIDSTQVGSPLREGKVLEVIHGEVSVSLPGPMGGRTRELDRTPQWDRPHRPGVEESLSGSHPWSIADTASYLLVDVPIEEAPERAAFAYFAWRFSFSDLLATVFELFEPPLSLLAIVPLETERPKCERTSLGWASSVRRSAGPANRVH